MHLSGIEHDLVRKFGFQKGIAITNLTSTRVFDEVVNRYNSFGHSDAVSSLSPLSDRVVAAIPFYGGDLIFL